MAEEMEVGCARPTGGPVGETIPETPASPEAAAKEVLRMIQVGKKVPEVLTPPVGRNINESIRQIQAFQLVRDSKGTQATPSGWRPGKTTLTPGPDLVGKVWEVWKHEMAFD